MRGVVCDEQTYNDHTPPLCGRHSGTKDAILKFIRDTADQSKPSFVPPAERIAEFDQDGTLWVEHPLYTQVFFCLDRVPALAKEKPELGQRGPFKAVLSGGRDAIAHREMRYFRDRAPPAARLTMWVLTLPQVAATLAATLVAYDTRNAAGQRLLLDGTMLNAVLVLMRYIDPGAGADRTVHSPHAGRGDT